LRGRVAIPHTGSVTQLRNVTRHELVHAFMNDKLTKILGDRKRFDVAPPPLWFSEGLAEYVAIWEPDTEARMFLRDLVVNDNLVEMPELWRIHGTFLMYKEGESLVGYIAGRFGDDALRQILENWWRADRFEDVLELTLGITALDLNRDWTRFLKRRYYPAVMEAEWPEQRGVACTRGPGIHSRPAPYSARTSPDGRSDFVFLSTASGSIDLVHARALGDTTGGEPPRYEEETLVRGGRGERYESFPAFASGPEIHAHRVAFTVKSGERDALVVWDLERREETARFKFDRLVALATPTWAPDGTALVFSGLDRGGWPDLYRVELATGALQRLTHDSADDRDPDWSHDGQRIAWSSDRGVQDENGVYRIWMLDLATGATAPLTSGSSEDATPAWSPDDRSLLFTSDAAGRHEVYLYEFDPHRVTRISAALGGIFAPQWTPDGRGFLASVFSNTSYNVYRFDFERADPRSPGEPAEPRVALAEAEPPRHDGSEPSDWVLRVPGQQYPTREYQVRFGLDFVRTAVAFDPGFASAAGGQVGLTDMLGNHKLSFYATNGASSFDEFWRHLNVGATYTNQSRRVQWSVGGFHLTSTYDPRLDRYRYERRYGALVGAAYPLSRFRRIESTFVGRVADMDELDAAILGVGSHAFLLSNFTAFVHDNTLWSFTGPVDGTRLNLTAGHTFDLSGANRGGTALAGDLRRYFPIAPRTVFAARAVGRGSFGPDLQYFFLGGPYDLRGYRLRSLFARRTALLNGELRFPLLDRLLIGLPFHSLDLGGFRGAAFADAAYLGWPYQSWFGSVGMGFELWLGPGMVARLDVGRTHDFDRFTSDTFTHFFLGWDY
jgi:hypothetical protein